MHQIYCSAKKYMKVTLIILNLFLALTVIAGGIGLIAGFGAPQIDLLQNSIFSDFKIPGLILMIIVGGSSLIASVLLIKRDDFAFYMSLIAGVVIIIFETVEIFVIGSPEGVARNLQLVYFLIGIIISLLSRIQLKKTESE